MNKRMQLSGLEPNKVLKNYSLWLPVFFLIFVFFLGGGSRSDIASIPILRGGSLLFAFWAALNMRPDDWRRVRVPLLLMVTLTIWIAMQLVPLPPELWHGLPGREAVVAADRLLGRPDLWRPLSLTPSQTANSLTAMLVPIAAILLVAQTASEDYTKLMLTIVGIACVSVALGFAQIFSGPESIAYLYRITSRDAMVGLFANRNHHAIFLACCLPIVAMLLRDELMRKRRSGLAQGILAIVGLALATATALIGSRVGLLAGGIAFVFGYLMILSAWRVRIDRGGATGSVQPPLGKRALLYAPPVLIAGLLGLALWLSDRITGLSRLVEQDIAADLRIQAWPTVEAMIAKYWVFGSGFGSFPDVYKMFEPDKLLQPSYFNHAHNDWAELVMTGGAPFVLILIAAFVWVFQSAATRGTRNLIKGYRGDIRLSALIAIILLGLSSLFDYPLRVPSIQVIAVILVILFCAPRQAAMVRG